MSESSPSRVLLTVDDITSMQEECARLEKELSDLESRKAEIEGRRAAARERLSKIDELLAALGITTAPPHDASFVPDVSKKSEIVVAQKRSRAVRKGKIGWAAEILKAVANGPFQSLAFPQIRSAIMDGHLAENLKASEKGYYNALSRLQKNGGLVREGGRLFLPEGFRAFRDARANGIADQSFVEAHRPSPMADAIIAFVSETGPHTTGSSIIEHLKADERFAGSVGRNATAGYNVLARLVQREQLIRGNGGYSIPDAKMAPTNAEAMEIPRTEGSDQR